MIGQAHFRLSKFCIRYLATEEVLHYGSTNNGQESNDDQDSDDEQYLEIQFPFLLYAIENWVSHTQIAEAQQISQGDILGIFN